MINSIFRRNAFSSYVRCASGYALQFLLLLSLAACSTVSPAPGASNDERVAFIHAKADKVFQRIESKHGPGLVAWIELDGQAVYKNSAGLADKNRGLFIDDNTIFELASVSKPLTATTILLLAERGQLKIDDVAMKWLPELPPNWRSITIRNLLTHSSGIPDYIKRLEISKVHELDGLTNQNLLERWHTNLHLNFEPGTDVEYSNSNYVLLAEIISKVCNMSFGECMRQRMFDPLGMTHTRVASEMVSDEPLALNYASTTLTHGINLLTEGPIGIFSSITDMATWLHAFQAGNIVSNETVALMTTPASTKPANESGEFYGMGWFLPSKNSPAGTYAHIGQKDGYRTLIKANPKRHLNFIIFDNGGDLLEQERNEIRYWFQQAFENYP
jgi:CubicO group peptidase (beta-lactamase class C family)